MAPLRLRDQKIKGFPSISMTRLTCVHGRVRTDRSGQVISFCVMDVLLTIDTEVHPCTDRWRENSLAAEIEQYIYGRTPHAEYGLRYQLSVLRRHRLKAVFFVEALFALELGPQHLAPIVSLIKDEGHEVQLHVHTEWLSYLSRPLLGGRRGLHIREFSEEDQVRIVANALESLAACGILNVCSFRAGNYGADSATLRALARNGLRYDSSWNAAYLGGACRLDTGEPLLAPRQIAEGVCEVPIAFFHDYPRHVRHAQLAACSFGELKGALLQAERYGWPAFVIVSHTFELVWRGVRNGRPATPRRLVIRRFERLCRFLDENRDRLPTIGFGQWAPWQRPRPQSCLYDRRSSGRLGACSNRCWAG